MFLNADAKINKKTVPVNLFGKKMRNQMVISAPGDKCTKADVVYPNMLSK